MKNLTKERDELNLKKALKKVETRAKAFSISENNLKESLEATLISNKKLEEELSLFKDELVETSDQYFERVNEQLSFLYPDTNLSRMDLFKRT